MPPSTTTSRPGRLLAVLAILLVVMLGGILRGNVVHPGNWHSSFKVGLGLDLSSGTQVTLKAVPLKGQQTPSKADMSEAISIMNERVNSAGFSGAVVQQQGAQNITVSVPGAGAQQVVGLVGTTAQLRFRQVLLEADNYSTAAPSASPSASPSGSASPSESASPASSASAKATTSASPSASGSAGSGQALGARHLGASASPSPSPSSSSSTSASSPSPSSSASTPASTAPVLSTTADGEGDAAMLTAQTKKLFDELNCAKNWRQQIYHGNANAWDDVTAQTVGCDGKGLKYALAPSPVTGQMLTSAKPGLSSTSAWLINFSLDSKGAAAFSKLTTQMYDKYFADSTTNPVDAALNSFAIVLDGNVISAPEIQGAIIGGQGQISGQFTEASATSLANVLRYGALPLTFQKQDIQSVSPELGAAQLSAGLIAAAVGLLLVVIYSFLYYRGLGLVSVSSLVIAALLSYLSVVLLSRYQGFTLSLDGVAGLIVAIGITADSFVVYFERLRDEVREGRSLRTAVERGWGRARRTILVSDTVSFLAAALLYFIAIGDVKGFAFTLGMTTLVDVVVVFLFTKPMITLLARTRFFGQGHKLSGLDPARLGARSPWRGSRRPPGAPAPGGLPSASSRPVRTSTKEA